MLCHGFSTICIIMSWSEWRRQHFRKNFTRVYNFCNCLLWLQQESSFCGLVWAGLNLNKSVRHNFSYHSRQVWYAVWCFQLHLLRDVARLEHWTSQSSSSSSKKNPEVYMPSLDCNSWQHVTHEQKAHTYTAPVPGQLLAATDAIPQTFAYLMLCGKQRWICVKVSRTYESWKRSDGAEMKGINSRTGFRVVRVGCGDEPEFSFKKKKMTCEVCVVADDVWPTFPTGAQPSEQGRSHRRGGGIFGRRRLRTINLPGSSGKSLLLGSVAAHSVSSMLTKGPPPGRPAATVNTSRGPQINEEEENVLITSAKYEDVVHTDVHREIEQLRELDSSQIPEFPDYG